MFDDSSIIPVDLYDKKLDKSFFDVDCVTLAHNLLGKILVRQIPTSAIAINSDCDTAMFLAARIVETESYLGYDDKASHSYNGRKTLRNEAMYFPPGHAYVYQLHTHHCLNITAGWGGQTVSPGAAVLIRAVQPLYNVELMMKNRISQRRSPCSLLRLKDLCNGPGKLCAALKISKNLNKHDLTGSKNEDVDSLFIVDDLLFGLPALDRSNIGSSERIGIGKSAQEWIQAPLRFFVKDNEFVSKLRILKKV